MPKPAETTVANPLHQATEEAKKSLSILLREGGPRDQPPAQQSASKQGTHR